MTAKEELKTKTGKPYFRVGFRDADREVSFPIWGDSPWPSTVATAGVPACSTKSARSTRNQLRPQLDIRKIRETIDADAADGFDPSFCLPRSRFDPQEMSTNC